ncbi:hypothetical protein [Bacillus sp. FJAT-49736]|uniref:hypothetical protein n=1 Tax=Bacillus sp. FJAT-49736 TaxID=2833582 RepID=UPI001BC8E434|nr:hypothetical protein [Bacillus sp. FJAT-49736]MBS4175132.1 hypothetical protein [Bacillus sp. FJAT-49736]
MRVKIIFIMLTGVFILAGCSESKEKANQPTTKQAVTTEITKPAVTSVKGEHPTNSAKISKVKLQKLELDHIHLSVPSNWTITKGLDSASFQLNDKPIGGLDGLGYSSSIESLLPNQSKILDKKEIAQSPFKMYSIILQRDAMNGQKAEEIHILYLLPEQKIAYDLHFDLSRVKEDTALKIAKTALK